MVVSGQAVLARERLAYRAPLDFGALLGYLGARAVDGVEAVAAGGYVRVLAAPGGPASVQVSAGRAGALGCRLELGDPADRGWVVGVVRRMFDLDHDPAPVAARLGADAALGPLVAARPGLRAPGAASGFEVAVRAIVGQQISVPAARTVLGRIAARFGTPVFDGSAVLFPTAAQLAVADPAALPMPLARGSTITTLARAVADGALDLSPGADRAATRAGLLALRGVGPWTADYVAMRALGDRDVLLTTDLGVRAAARALDVDLADGRPDWAPWRSYASQYLWASLAEAR